MSKIILLAFNVKNIVCVAKILLLSRWIGSVDPIYDGVVIPDVSSSKVSVGWQQGSEHGGLSSSVHSEGPLVAAHVSVHKAGVDMIHHNVRSGVFVHHPLLDPEDKARKV